MKPKQKQYPVVDVTGDRSKVRCCKEQCQVRESRQIGSGQTGDGKSERQHSRNQQTKMDWMGEFNSNDHYIYYCGQESLRRNGIAIMVNKSPKCSTWMQSQKWQNELCSFPRQTIQYHSNPSQCPHQWRWRSWSWMVLWRPVRSSRTNTEKRCPFHYRGLECKSRKSKNTWGNRQICP